MRGRGWSAERLGLRVRDRREALMLAALVVVTLAMGAVTAWQVWQRFAW
ncbi:hypothetical protein KOAAANKH_00086 [Brevundimonas sp. NIBR10]|nr:hypothetical protein KOAAANKH_00086 [Brevundimonas sp. NIBR10]